MTDGELKRKLDDAVFEHAFELAQEFPEEQNPKMIFDPCNADDKINAISSVKTLIGTIAEQTEQDAWKEGYDQGYRDAKNGN